MVRTHAALARAVGLLGALAFGASAQTKGARSAPPPLSAFAAAKADALLHRRLPCLGCHQLGDEGGRIGPDLTAVGRRRSFGYIAAMIRDPQATVPGTLMPKTPMPEAWRDLVATYLWQRSGGATESPPADSLGRGGALEPLQAGGRVDGAALYARRCAACHGPSGRGDGPNAAYLPVHPAVHADSAYLSTRPDDVLYDAIAAGGYVMNRSHLMPAFGESLTREEIRALVRHLRVLCRCQGPAWSRDGR